MRSFGNYMQEWLYGKKGYYRKALIGPKGDFYTSVSLSKFFGGAIAFYIIKLLEEEKLFLPLKIVEIGSHHGHFLSDIASFLNALSVGVMEKCEFVSCEPLKELQNIQRTIFKQATQLDLISCALEELDFKEKKARSLSLMNCLTRSLARLLKTIKCFLLPMIIKAFGAVLMNPLKNFLKI